MIDVFLRNPEAQGLSASLAALLVAYLMGQAIALVYTRTHRGVSFSRSFVVGLVVAGVLSAVLMIAIGNNLARGIGIAGTMALIRFRMQLHDPLDMMYLFASFAGGVAAGTGYHALGGMGTGVFLLVVWLLQVTRFGSRQLFDGVLRLELPVREDAEEALASSLRAHCRHFAAVALREIAQGQELERVYQITLRDPGKSALLVRDLAAIAGVHGVSVAMQESTHEI